MGGYSFLLASSNPLFHDELLECISEYIDKKQIIDIFPCKTVQKNETIPKTVCGKYSYGPLCDDMYVERCGAFCSFADGCSVVPNHPLEYLSTHPIIYEDCDIWEGFRPYDEMKGERWYMPGIKPKGKVDRKRIIIGSDVWLGKNVIITNYSNIGNGVIAGAGSIITKNVPDFAIVVGNPARILRYRYTKEQIKELLKISWWNWTDEDIINNYDDFLLPVEEFIEKHKCDDNRA